MRVVSRPFRFATQGAPFTDADALRDHARRVEALGYEELFSFDHLGAVDPFLPLLVAAEATTMLRVGPLVLNNGFHNPALLARTAATFDALTGGRLVLGIGAGYMRAEHEASGIALLAPGARVARLDESLRAVRALLDTGACSLAGDHVAIEVERLGVRPQQESVPFLIGGHGRLMVELGAEHADVFQFTGLEHDATTGAPVGRGFAVETIEERVGWLRDAAGSRFDTIELSALVQVAHLGEGAHDVASQTAARLGCDLGVVERTPFAMIGTVEEVADKLRRLRDELGINHYVVRDPAGFAPVVDALGGT